MNLTLMRTNVRRDLKDENSPQRLNDDEVNRAIARAVIEVSKASPRQMKSSLATVASSYDIDISTLTNRLSVDYLEFPLGYVPRNLISNFEIYQDTLTMLDRIGDGNNCYVYWTTVHNLDVSLSTLPGTVEDLVALGAVAYLALSMSQYATDKVSYGGQNVDRDYLYWAKGRLMDFEAGLKKLKSKLKINQLYV